MTRAEYVILMRETFVTLGVRAVMSELVSRWSFFALPFFNPLTKLAVDWVVKFLAKNAETAAFFLYTDMRVGDQSNEFEKAAVKNFVVQRSGTPEEKRAAEADLVRAFTAFASLRN